MKYEVVVINLFMGLIAGLATIGVSIMRDMSKDLSDLNSKIAVIIARVDTYETRIARLESKHDKN